MAVEMEGVFACVVVVEDYLYDFVVLEDVGVGVDAVDGGVVGEVAGGESSVEGWYDRADVGYIVEECARIVSQLRFTVVGRGGCILVGSVPQDVHLEVKFERVVDWPKKLFTVCWHQGEVVKLVECIKKNRRG